MPMMPIGRIKPDQWFELDPDMQARYLENKIIYENWLAAPVKVQSVPIEPIPEPTRTGMNHSKTVFLINDQVRAIRGSYQQDGTTAVFKTLDQTIKKDDLVVVQTGTRHGMTVIKTTEVDIDLDMDSPEKIEWVVQKVDQQAFSDLIAQEDEMLAKVKKAELRKKRGDLADALFKDDMEAMKALPIAHMAAPAIQPPKS